MSEAVDLHEEVRDLRERVAELEAIVEDLQGDTSGTSSSSGFGDWRDQAVLDQLVSGNRVSAGTLKRMYRVHGDITASTTLKQRVKSLVQTGPFEDAGGHAVFRYTGGEGE